MLASRIPWAVRIADLTGRECYLGGFGFDTFAGGAAGCACVWVVAPPESEGSSIVFRDPRKRKSTITARPSTIPRTIPIKRSLKRERPRIRATGSANAVEQPPVGLEVCLGRRDERILVLGRHCPIDQAA